MGFNTIRVPLSVQYMVENDYHILDEMVNFMDDNDMQWVLDIHRVGNDYQQANWDVGIKEVSYLSLDQISCLTSGSILSIASR